MKVNTDFKPTKIWAKRTLKAVDELIEAYKTATHDNISCPLCVLGTTWSIRMNDDTDNSPCKYCPWLVFKGGSCLELKYKRASISKRISRLYGWRTKLRNIINKQEANMKITTYNKIKLFTILLFFLYLSTGCASVRPYPYPEVKTFDVGDMVCTLDRENTDNFKQWFIDFDGYVSDVERVGLDIQPLPIRLFKFVEIGDAYCVLTIEEKAHFDQWTIQMRRFATEVERLR